MGTTNLFVPASGFAFVAPSLIAHYVDAHEYCPPIEFQEAVLACHEMRSMPYLKAVSALGLIRLKTAPPQTHEIAAFPWASLVQVGTGSLSVEQLGEVAQLNPEEMSQVGPAALRKAVQLQGAQMLSGGLALCARYGFSEIDPDLFRTLLEAEWHQAHEPIVDAVVRLRDPLNVDALWSLARKHLAYRTWENREELEVKCTYGLWRLETAQAIERLAELTNSGRRRTRALAARLLRELAANSSLKDEATRALNERRISVALRHA